MNIADKVHILDKQCFRLSLLQRYTKIYTKYAVGKDNCLDYMISRE